MNTDEKSPNVTAAPPTPQERFEKLATISPIQRALRARPMFLIALAIAVALTALVFSAYSLWVPAAELLESYAQRLWDQIF